MRPFDQPRHLVPQRRARQDMPGSQQDESTQGGPPFRKVCNEIGIMLLVSFGIALVGAIFARF